MLSREALQQMSQIDIQSTSVDSLADIGTVRIDASLPIEELYGKA